MNNLLRATVVLAALVFNQASFAELKPCNFSYDCEEGLYCSLEPNQPLPTPEVGSPGYCFEPDVYDKNHNLIKKGTFEQIPRSSHE
jgi:hypothetical protein